MRSEIRDPNEELIIIMTKYSLRERSYKFSVELVKFQLIRSGTSIGANVEEADSSSSRKDFRNKMFIAKKEAAETVYWLRLLIDANVVNNQANVEKIKDLLDECDQILRIIGKITRRVEV